MGGREAWLGQGAMCGSEEGRVRGCDQDGETKAGLGGMVRLRSHDEYWALGIFWLFGYPDGFRQEEVVLCFWIPMNPLSLSKTKSSPPEYS